jgi:DNA polymerase III delta prime subunit
MCNLKETYRPKRLADIIGQPCIRPLRMFVAEPYPCCILLEGATGTGKSATAEVLAEALGCVNDGPWDSVYPEPAAKFDTETVNYYFEPATSPFRFVVPRGKFHVLLLEELEYMVPQVQRLCKVHFETAPDRWKLIIVATSNDTSKLPAAVRHRFANAHYHFSSGPGFADAINAWLPSVWAAEVGPGVDMPYNWRLFGWDGAAFSARLALDTLQKFVTLERQRAGELEAVA